MFYKVHKYMMFYIGLIIVFMNSISSFSVVKINSISDDLKPLIKSDRANKCERSNVFPGVETNYVYLAQNANWHDASIYVDEGETMRFEIVDNDNLLTRRDYLVIVKFHPISGTIVWSFPYDDKHIVGYKNLTMTDTYKNYIPQHFDHTYISRHYSDKEVVNNYFSLKEVMLNDVLNFWHRKTNILLRKDDILEIELLNKQDTFNAKQNFSSLYNKMADNNGWFFPRDNIHNQIIRFKMQDNRGSYDKRILSYMTVYNNAFDYSHSHSLWLDMINDLGIYKTYSFGEGLMVLNNSIYIKSSMEKFFDNKHLYYHIGHEGFLNFRFAINFDHSSFLRGYNSYVFKNYNQIADDINEYVFGSYTMKVSVTSAQAEKEIKCKIVSSQGDRLFVLKGSQDIKIPATGKLFLKCADNSNIVSNVGTDNDGSSNDSLDNSNVLQIKIVRDVDVNLISGFIHDYAMMLIDVVRSFSEIVYLNLSQNNMLQVIFKMIVIIVASIYLIWQDTNSIISLSTRVILAAMIMFNFNNVNMITAYVSDGLLELIKSIYNIYFNTLTFNPFQVFDMVFLKLIGPFTVVFIGQILCTIFALFVLSFMFSFFTRLLWGLIAQSFILPLDIYVSILHLYFFIAFAPILIVFFLFFDFSRDIPIVFIRHLIGNVVIKIISLFVFVVYLEFIISFVLDVLGSELVVCYDSNGLPISDDGVEYNFWSIVLLYSLSLIIIPSINKLQRVLRGIMQ
ncbi:MAG: hypothetical protein AAFO15_00570 [Pseudomonadota bacterium]